MAHLLLIVLLLAGIILAVALVQTKTNIFPHAQEAANVTPKTAFHLLQGSGVNPDARAINPPPDVFRPGDDIQVHVAVSSDIEAANTFSAVVSYPKDLLEVTSIIKETLVLPVNKNPKIDSHISGLIAGSPSDRERIIKDYGIRLKGNKILVELRVAKKGLTATDLQYQKNGFEETNRSETYLIIDGYADLDKLIKMADNPNISYISLIIEPANNLQGGTGTTNAASIQTISASACGVACNKSDQCQGAKDGCTSCLPNDQGTGNICRPAKPSTICAQVITRACQTIFDPNCRSDGTTTVACTAPKEECKDFPTPCDVPSGWVIESPNRSPSPSFCGGIAGIQCSAGYTCRLTDPPDQSDRSGICEPNQTSPSPSCKPRPACLDSNPRCMIPETADMCPPNIQPDVQNYFIQLWLPDTGFNNDTGLVTLSGGVQNPGIKTTPPNKPIMATIVFKAKKVGEARLDFTENSLILGSSGNSNLLTAKNGLSISIQDQNKPTVPGDIDGDGVVGFKDFSILLSKWGSDDKTADINSDGKINIFDFSILLTNWTGRKK